MRRGGTCRPESPDQEAVVSFTSFRHCRVTAAFLNVTVHVLESNSNPSPDVLRRGVSGLGSFWLSREISDRDY